MRPVYATRLNVLPTSGQTPDSLFELLTAQAHRWMVTEVGPLPNHERPWALIIMDGHDDTYRVTNETQTCRVEVKNLALNDERAWLCTLVHPFQEPQVQRPDLQLRTEIQIRLDHPECVVTIRRLIGTTTDLIGPHTFDVAAPSLVHDIIGACTTVCGNIEVRPGQWLVDETHARNLADLVIRHDRMSPLVIISRTAAGRTLVDAAALAGALTGLAQVAELETADAAGLFSELTGLAVPLADGNVRVFWPGFSLRDQPAKHQIFSAEDLERPGASDEIHRSLRQMLGDLAAWTFGSDRRIRELELETAEAEAEERDRAIAELIAEVEGVVAVPADPGPGGKRVVWKLGELRGWLRSERAAIQVDRETIGQLLDEASRDRLVADQRASADYQVFQRVNDLQAMELAGLKEERAKLEGEMTVWREQALATPPAVTDAVGKCLDHLYQARKLGDVLVVVKESANRDAIVFLPEAERSARQSRFHGKLLAASELLRSVCRVAQRYHDGAIRDAGFRDAFVEEGEPDFAADSSPTTLTMHKSAYTVLYDDGSGRRAVLLGPHIGIGGGHQGTSVKVYWYVDQLNRRFVVGHVGTHLPTAGF